MSVKSNRIRRDLAGGQPRVLFRYRQGKETLAGLGATVTGPANRFYYDQAGGIQVAGLNATREAAYVRTSAGLWVPTLLMEAQRTNLFLQLVPAKAQLHPTHATDPRITDVGAAGGWGAGLRIAPSAASHLFVYQSPVALAASTQHTITLEVEMEDGSVPVPSLAQGAGDFSLVIANVMPTTLHPVRRIAATNRYLVSATLTTNAAPTQSAGLVAYNNQSLKPFTVRGWQIEAGAFPTSWIFSNGGAAMRTADWAYVPWPHAPQEMTFYAELVELGTTLSGVTLRLAQIGVGAGDPRWIAAYSNSSGRWQTFHSHTGASVSQAIAQFTAHGDELRMLTHLRSTGAIGISVAINSGAPVVGSTNAGSINGLVGEWGPTARLAINADPAGASSGFIGIRSLIIAAGVHDYNKMSRLAR